MKQSESAQLNLSPEKVSAAVKVKAMQAKLNSECGALEAKSQVSNLLSELTLNQAEA